MAISTFETLPSRSCALPNIKVLKDKDLEFSNSIPPFLRQRPTLTSQPLQTALWGLVVDWLSRQGYKISVSGHNDR